jgi:hypothetical protein
MKSLATHKLVALALTLWGTPSMAGTVESSSLPVNPAEQSDRPSVTAATVPAPLYALNPLDAESLPAQKMTDQELTAVEGASIDSLCGGKIILKIELGDYYSYYGGFAGASASATAGN